MASRAVTPPSSPRRWSGSRARRSRHYASRQAPTRSPPSSRRPTTSWLRPPPTVTCPLHLLLRRRELRRILIPRNRVNKGINKGRDVPVRHPKLLVAGKWSQDLDVVLGGNRHQSLHVGRLRRRYAQLLGRFAHFHRETLEACGIVLQQYPGRLRSVYLEAVGYSARSVDKCTSPGFHPLLSDVEGHLALDDVEGLVLVTVHVVGRGEPGRKDVIDEAEGAGCLLTGGLHYHEGAQEPHRLTFFPGQRVRLSAHIHCVPSSFGWAMPIREL